MISNFPKITLWRTIAALIFAVGAWAHRVPHPPQARAGSDRGAGGRGDRRFVSGRILIVEDDEAIATGLSLNLKLAGRTAAIARGRAAAPRRRRLRPQAVRARRAPRAHRRGAPPHPARGGGAGRP